MIKIIKINIQRFRSIMDLTLEINVHNNIVSICGPNNVGKTNVLRALNLFFNPKSYNPKTDIPTIKNATWGGAVHPKITIDFLDELDNRRYVVIRDFKSCNKDDINLSGYYYDGLSKKSKTSMKQNDVTIFLERIQFFYIESVNLVIPDIIDKITEDMISLEYDRARFTKNKVELRDAYNTYIDGLQEILNIFANDISDTFRRFRDSWSVVFNVPKNSETFRDLISDDVTLTIKDGGSTGIIEKGSGLQRLALIILLFEIVERLKSKKNAIICIDEPDSFLHEGLQRKLKDFLNEKSLSIQMFLTTHSKVFIDTFDMHNTILLDAKLYNQYVTRKKKEIDVMETYLVNINSDEGYKIICEHLGIEEKNYEILEKFNLLVEGECDKKYILELAKYFNLREVNIISANGVDNMIKYLEFYESYYKNIDSYIPQIRIILDNDSKGREVFKKVQAKNYYNIKIELMLIPNFLCDSDTNLEKNYTNNEIEDFVYPEVICELINKLLKKRKMNMLNTKKLCKKIQTKSFKSAGILNLCEHLKNEKNPEKGTEITFTSSHEGTNRIKEGLAGMFNIEGNRSLIEILNLCNDKYPKVKENLIKILESIE